MPRRQKSSPRLSATNASSGASAAARSSASFASETRPSPISPPPAYASTIASRPDARRGASASSPSAQRPARKRTAARPSRRFRSSGAASSAASMQRAAPTRSPSAASARAVSSGGTSATGSRARPQPRQKRSAPPKRAPQLEQYTVRRGYVRGRSAGTGLGAQRLPADAVRAHRWLGVGVAASFRFEPRSGPSRSPFQHLDGDGENPEVRLPARRPGTAVVRTGRRGRHPHEAGARDPAGDPPPQQPGARSVHAARVRAGGRLAPQPPDRLVHAAPEPPTQRTGHRPARGVVGARGLRRIRRLARARAPGRPAARPDRARPRRSPHGLTRRPRGAATPVLVGRGGIPDYPAAPAGPASGLCADTRSAMTSRRTAALLISPARLA